DGNHHVGGRGRDGGQKIADLDLRSLGQRHVHRTGGGSRPVFRVGHAHQERKTSYVLRGARKNAVRGGLQTVRQESEEIVTVGFRAAGGFEAGRIGNSQLGVGQRASRYEMQGRGLHAQTAGLRGGLARGFAHGHAERKDAGNRGRAGKLTIQSHLHSG